MNRKVEFAHRTTPAGSLVARASMLPLRVRAGVVLVVPTSVFRASDTRHIRPRHTARRRRPLMRTARPRGHTTGHSARAVKLSFHRWYPVPLCPHPRPPSLSTLYSGWTAVAFFHSSSAMFFWPSKRTSPKVGVPLKGAPSLFYPSDHASGSRHLIGGSVQPTRLSLSFKYGQATKYSVSRN